MSDERADSLRIQEVVREPPRSEERRIIEGQVRATNSHPPAKPAPAAPPPAKKQ
jgi:hypothetical protein